MLKDREKDRRAQARRLGTKAMCLAVAFGAALGSPICAGVGHNGIVLMPARAHAAPSVTADAGLATGLSATISPFDPVSGKYIVSYAGAETGKTTRGSDPGPFTDWISLYIYDGAEQVHYAALKDITGGAAAGMCAFELPATLEAGKPYTFKIAEEMWDAAMATGYKSNEKTAMELTLEHAPVADDFTVLMDESFFLGSPGEAVGPSGTLSPTDRIRQASVVKFNGVTQSAAYYDIVKAEDIAGMEAYSQMKAAPSFNNITIPDGEAGYVRIAYIYAGSARGSSADTIPTVAYVDIDISDEKVACPDDAAWYTDTDEETGIEWKFRSSATGEISSLHTERADISGIVSGGTLRVPASIHGKKVLSIGGGIEDGTPLPFIPSGAAASFTHISLPEGIEQVCDYAFYHMAAGADIDIPRTVSRIGKSAFEGSGLTRATMNGMAGEIASSAFASCADLKHVSIRSGGNVSIAPLAFRASGLESASLAGDITVGRNAFKDLASLKGIYLEGAVSLSGFSFNGCPALESVALPAGTSVEPYAFNACTGITQVETSVPLPPHAFNGSEGISVLIACEGAERIAYDWDGPSPTGAGYAERKVFVRDNDVLFGFYSGAGLSYSSLGKGDVSIYIPQADVSQNMGGNVEAEDGAIWLNAYTLYRDAEPGASGSYVGLYKGEDAARTVSFHYGVNIDTELSGAGIMDSTKANSEWTGITASVPRALHVGDVLGDGDAIVRRMYGPVLGEEVAPGNYYLFRIMPQDTYDYRTGAFSRYDAEAGGAVPIASKEALPAEVPEITALESDIPEGMASGSFDICAITFVKDGEGEEHAYTATAQVKVAKGSELEKLTAAYGELESLTEMGDRLLSDTEGLARAIGMKQKVQEALQGLLDIAASTKEDKAALERSIRSKEAQIASLQATYATMEDKESAEAAAIKEQADALDGQLAIDQEKLSAMEKEDAVLAALKGELSSLEARNAELAASLDPAGNDAARLDGEMKGIEEELAALRSGLSSLKAEHDAKANEKAAKEAELAAAEAAAANADADERAGLEGKAAGLTEEVRALDAELSGLGSRIGACEESIASIQAELSAKRAEYLAIPEEERERAEEDIAAYGANADLINRISFAIEHYDKAMGIRGLAAASAQEVQDLRDRQEALGKMAEKLAEHVSEYHGAYGDEGRGYLGVDTSGGESVHYVYVGGESRAYIPEPAYDIGGNKAYMAVGTIPAASSTGATKEANMFYVADDGVHLLSVPMADDGEGNEAPDLSAAEEVGTYSDTAWSAIMEAAIILRNIQEPLEVTGAAIEDLYQSLLGASEGYEGKEGDADADITGIKEMVQKLLADYGDISAEYARVQKIARDNTQDMEALVGKDGLEELKARLEEIVSQAENVEERLAIVLKSDVPEGGAEALSTLLSKITDMNSDLAADASFLGTLIDAYGYKDSADALEKITAIAEGYKEAKEEARAAREEDLAAEKELGEKEAQAAGQKLMRDEMQKLFDGLGDVSGNSLATIEVDGREYQKEAFQKGYEDGYPVGQEAAREANAG